jgi:hypothetical protein
VCVVLTLKKSVTVKKESIKKNIITKIIAKIITTENAILMLLYFATLVTLVV